MLPLVRKKGGKIKYILYVSVCVCVCVCVHIYVYIAVFVKETPKQHTKN